MMPLEITKSAHGLLEGREAAPKAKQVFKGQSLCSPIIFGELTAVRRQKTQRTPDILCMILHEPTHNF